MKKILILILICTTQNIFSQSKKSNDILTIDDPTTKNHPQGDIPNDDYTVYNTAGIDVRPEFPGGIIEFNKFIEQNFKIPKDGLKGKIYTTFVIEKDGSLSGIKVLRDIGYETGSEAIRVLQLSPKWKPGKQNNKLVRVLYSAPLYINIPSN
ncbi:energy transducer TonB [Flavobacterium sp. P21]|uniref:energy transducer TonB n=1 Tax=Flavobacterium sp. P21 TaxID=3423948 RepID=UPI003D678FBE